VQLKRFVELSKRKNQLEAELKAVKADIEAVKDPLMQQFSQDGMTKATVDGMTVYISSQLWASAKDGDAAGACAVLKKIGLADYVKENFNTQSLSAYVREVAKNGEDYPEGFLGVIEIIEKFDLRAVKA
jgi:hypothetical protein